MANKGRGYAENLVGQLDRSYFDPQRTVAQQTYNTNWENVQNQYNKLQDKLKRKQQQANTEFAEGLGTVANNSYDRMRQGTAGLANKGLTASGINNMLEQSDIKQKGEDVYNLLKSAGDVSLETAGQLASATTKAANEETNLMGKLGDALGKIGDAETALQNRYNNTLAGIAGSMDVREFNNYMNEEQLKLEEERLRQARASAGSSGAQKKANKDLEDFYKKAAIAEVLQDETMNDKQKSNYLGILFGIDNADKAVSAYNKNITAQDDYNKKVKQLEKDAKKANEKIVYYQTPSGGVSNTLYEPSTLQIGQKYNDKIIVNNGDGTSSLVKKDLINSQNKRVKASDIMNTNAQTKLDDFKKKGITYEELAELLYGSK